MDNIYKLKDCIQPYIERKIKERYTFDMWKETLVYCRNDDQQSAINLWNFFSDKFYVTNLNPDVEASKNPWSLTLQIEFNWKIKDKIVGIRTILIEDEIKQFGVCDQLNLFKTFGENFDFTSEFEAKIIFFDEFK
jgi:hypothetical protein